MNNSKQNYLFRRISIIGLLALTVLITGCLKSLNPFYTFEDVIDAKAYSGVYKQGDSYWVFFPFNFEDFSIDLNDDRVNVGEPGVRSDAGLYELEFYNSKKANESIDTVGMTKEEIKSIREHAYQEFQSNKLAVFAIIEDSLMAVNFYESYLADIGGNEVYDPKLIIDEEEIDFYIAAFFKLEGTLLLDIAPYKILGDNSFSDRHNVPVHSLSKVIQKNGNSDFSIKFVTDSKLGDMLKNDQIRIKYESISLMPDINKDNSSDFLLTAETSELQAFVKKFVLKDEEFFTSSSNHTLDFKKIR